MDIPVYLFTGFLDSGKTTFIQETLQDSRFNSGDSTLLLQCEEGEIEYEPETFSCKNVNIVIVENEEELTQENLKKWQKDCNAKRVIVEYNGMWQLKSLFQNMPSSWIIYQEMCFAEASDYPNYNRNMRSLVADKLNGCELIVFNRCDKSTSKEELHKIVRSVNRKADIAYEFRDNHVEYDDIEDPLPFDITAEVIKIGDDDFAIWYYDLMENTSQYIGKTIEFVGLAARDRKMPRLEFAVGRHIMTCCEDDIQYGGVVASWEKAEEINTADWVKVTGKLKMEYNDLYGQKGPVLKIIKAQKVNAPANRVVTL